MTRRRSSVATGFAAQREQLTRAGVEFCLSDLDMALTMLDFASATSNTDTRERNRGHAQHALQTVLHHMSELDLAPAQREALDAKVAQLQERLEALTMAPGPRAPDADKR